MVIVDYSQVCIAAISNFFKDIEKGSPDANKDLIRHVILNSILGIRKKYPKGTYGDLVIAVDGRYYWRKDHFPHYKASRKKAREASSIDWGFIFDTIAEIRDDLKTHFPYKVVHVERAEADDVIAILAKYTQTNELIKEGMMMESQQVIAVSEDQDFVQLYKYPNFKLYQPRKKKLYPRPSVSALKDFVTEHIVKAGDDGIPNVLSPDDIFVQEPKGRQTTVSSKRLTEFKEQGKDACRDDIERRNWDRNRLMIDFEYIPADIEASIVEAYEAAECNSNRTAIFNYLVKNRCRQLLNSLEDF